MSLLATKVRPGLLVDLDSLFDTRLAILDLLDPMLAAHALQNGYLDREDNNFEYCPLALFNELYAKRDNEVLGRSMMTQVKSVVIDFIKDANTKYKTSKTQAYPSVYINVWPYKISEDAAGELLTPFHKAVEGKVHIHLINMAPNEITPAVCKERFSHMIMYDFMAWLMAVGTSGELQRNPMNEVTLIAPRLYPSGKPTDDELQTRNEVEPHACAELYFAPYVKLELYVAKLFSASLDNNFIEELVKTMNEPAPPEETPTPT
jgi:hypothetical protein